MNVIVDVSIIPIGVGVSLSKYVAACEKIFMEAGLNPKLHANGTNIEGEWEIVFGAIKECHDVLHSMGVKRLSSNLRIGTRIDRVQTMKDKISSVEKKLDYTK